MSLLRFFQDILTVFTGINLFLFSKFSQSFPQILGALIPRPYLQISPTIYIFHKFSLGLVGTEMQSGTLALTANHNIKKYGSNPRLSLNLQRKYLIDLGRNWEDAFKELWLCRKVGYFIEIGGKGIGE